MKVLSPYTPDVLICEDDDHFSHMIDFILRRESLRVVLAKDGQQAADYINDNPPTRLVILDVMMPFLDGFQIARQLRNDPRWRNVPVIMLSAKSNEKDIVKAFDEGANDYIIKPFQPTEFIARLKYQLRQSA
ncbi:MAG: response regulator transcription factor [Gammaproteobacteria bacterium]|nr:response regulator transcription factor [Gammaproteobacteria bacterium]